MVLAVELDALVQLPQLPKVFSFYNFTDTQGNSLQENPPTMSRPSTENKLFDGILL